ncbi:MAG: ferritin family protein [Acidobacteriota bacterium]|jgi:rubrerythrin
MGMPMDFAKLQPQDVLDIATFVEREAHDRYQELADEMSRRGASDAADFFRAMARRELRHGERLAARRKELFGDAPAHVRDVVFWEIEAIDYRHNLPAITLRQALELALSTEVKAHDYYAGALEYHTDPAVADLFEELRLAEVEHQRLIREELARLP